MITFSWSYIFFCVHINNIILLKKVWYSRWVDFVTHLNIGIFTVFKVNNNNMHYKEDWKCNALML